jgi:hypothetical protein
MILLLALADDIAAKILTSWLGVEDIVSIDCASCGGQRQPLQACLYSSATAYDTSHVLKDCNLRTANAYTSWHFSRNANVTGLHVSRALVEDVEQRDNYLQRHGRSITTIHAGEKSPCCPALIAALCTYCPNVTTIVCPVGLSLIEYSGLAHAWPNLRSITVTKGACGEALLLIARGCRELVNVSVDAEVSDEAKGRFLLELPSTVQTVDLGTAWYDPALGDDDVDGELNLFKLLTVTNLPHLQRFRKQDRFGFDDEVLLEVARRCSLTSVHISGYDYLSEFTYITLTSLCQLQEVTISDGHQLYEDSITALLQGCAPTLRKFTYEGGSSAAMVLEILGTCCAQLEELEVDGYW